MSYLSHQEPLYRRTSAQDACDDFDAMERTLHMTRRPYAKPQLERLGLLRTLTRFSCAPGAWGDDCIVKPAWHE